MKRTTRILIAAVIVASVGVGLQAPAEASLLPPCRPQPLPLIGFDVNQANAKHPVVIVGGTAAIEPLYWVMASRLMADHYYTYIFELPDLGSQDIEKITTPLLADCVNQALRERGASQVHLIAHSQGNTVARTYIHNHANRVGNNTVASLISLSGPWDGTGIVDLSFNPLQSPNIFDLLVEGIMAAMGCRPQPLIGNRPLPCVQLAPGSALLNKLNRVGEFVPGGAPMPRLEPSIFYSNIKGTYEAWIQPNSSTLFKAGECTRQPGEPPCNIDLTQYCPLRFVDHIGLMADAVVYMFIKDALERRVNPKLALYCSAL